MNIGFINYMMRMLVMMDDDTAHDDTDDDNGDDEGDNNGDGGDDDGAADDDGGGDDGDDDDDDGDDVKDDDDFSSPNRCWKCVGATSAQLAGGPGRCLWGGRGPGFASARLRGCEACLCEERLTSPPGMAAASSGAPTPP